MRLTAREHPEAIKRYAHVRPVPLWSGGRPCGSRCDGTALSCTRERGHRGPHVAHRPFRRVVAVWDAEARAAARDRPPRSTGVSSTSKRGARSPIGLPERHTGLLQYLRARLDRALASAEEIVFVVLFLAFVGFAVQWFLLILG